MSQTNKRRKKTKAEQRLRRLKCDRMNAMPPPEWLAQLVELAKAETEMPPVEVQHHETAAEDALLDQTLFTVSPNTYADLNERLDAPPAPNARLRRTITTPAPWEDEKQLKRSTQ